MPAARSSLLFTPGAQDSRRSRYADVAAASAIFEQNSSSSTSSAEDLPTPAVSFPASTSLGDSTASSSLRKSSQTDGASLLLSSGNATTGHLPLTSNAYNSVPSSTASAANGNAPPVPPRMLNFPNASHPAIIGAPIPATRFDTVTSYVDIIYQQQQFSSSAQADNRSKSETAPTESRPDGVVILSPSDGIDGDDSFIATCPKCVMMVMTEPEHVVGQRSYQMACLFTPLLMCWAPLYWDKLGRKWKDVKHWCPKCRSLVAIYRK